MADSAKLKPRGVLHLQHGRQNFHLDRALPAADLAHLVEHFWSVDWDLTGKPPYTSQTLPHPSVHLVIETGKSEIVGVMRGRFTRQLAGKGRVFGIKFSPGAFHAICREPVSHFTDRRVPAADFFGAGWLHFERNLLAQKDIHAMAPLAENFLHVKNVRVTEEAMLVRRIVDRTFRDPTILKVDFLCEQFSLNKRQLQRLFREYAGVSPQWVIERYRMHEALEQLSATTPPDLARLALSLGYFDQAHFQKAFRKMTGKSPGAYTRASR